MRKSGCLIVYLWLFMCGVQVAIAEDKIDFEITADYFGKYIWRGQNLSDDPVFQTGLSASYKGLTLGVWGSLETTGINKNAGEFTEWDYSLDYSGDFPGIKGIGYSVGVINYHFPGTVSDTSEVYWGLNFDLPLNPSITVYHDTVALKGSIYASFGLSHSIDKIFELAPDMPVGLDIGMSLGLGNKAYNNGYWGVNRSGLNDLAISISFPTEIKGWTLSPSLNYVTLLSEGIRASNTFRPDSDYFFFGIGLSKSF